MLHPLLADLFLPPASSTIAPDADGLFNFLYWLSVFFFVVITGGTLWFAWKFRMKKGEAQRLTPNMANSLTLELIWTVIPTIIVVFIFWWGFKWFVRMYVAPHNSYQISVTAHQWGWAFTYPNGVTYEHLVMPANRPVSLLMTSDDVIHSLFIPDFRVKMAVVKNRYSTMWFQCNEPGEHDLFCTEYCGNGHYRMYARVVVKSEKDFAQWLKSKELPADATPAMIGERLYKTQSCNSCHTVDGKPSTAPTFKGLWGTKVKVHTGGEVHEVLVDAQYVLDSIVTPGKDVVDGYGNVMNSYASLSAADRTALVEYIHSLGDAPPSSPVPAAVPESSPSPSKEH